MRPSTITIGIDPGWASCGVAVTSQDTEAEAPKLVRAFSFIPRELSNNDSTYAAVNELCNKLDPYLDMCAVQSKVVIERYVAYKGIHSDMSEKILMFIGALHFFFECSDWNVELVRAIDWKPTVCKHLVRTKGFSNPAQSFDKKFSLAAAQALSAQDFKIDHEADAVCLSFLPYIPKKE